MARAREHPYIWATWLAKLLTGENSCEWAGWFRAHHQDWAKAAVRLRPKSKWMLDHTALVNRERESHEKWGYTVYTENQNSFRLRGRTATLAGKPDLIAVERPRRRNHRREDRETVSGSRRPGQNLPVRGTQGAGAVPGDPVPGPRGLRRREAHAGVPESGVDREFVGRLGALIQPAGGGEAGQAGTQRPGVPVLRHHHAADCPDRIQGGTGEEGRTQDF